MMSSLKTSHISAEGLPVILHSTHVTFLLFPGPRSPSHSWAAGAGVYPDEMGTISEDYLPPSLCWAHLDSDPKQTAHCPSSSKTQLCPLGGISELLIPLSKLCI